MNLSTSNVVVIQHEAEICASLGVTWLLDFTRNFFKWACWRQSVFHQFPPVETQDRLGRLNLIKQQLFLYLLLLLSLSSSSSSSPPWPLSWAPQSSTSNLILVENIQRRATRFILRNSNLCYKARLIKLKLLRLSYWLEYLDLVFFFKCLHGLIDFTREFSYYFSFLKGNTRRASSGLHLKLNACRTSSFRDFYFNRITLMWNSLLDFWMLLMVTIFVLLN